MHSHLHHLAWHLTREQRLLGLATLSCLPLFSAPHLMRLSGTSSMFRKLLRSKRGPGMLIAGLWISDQARLRHTQVVGATGTGKTVLFNSLLFGDLKRGYGAIVIDPKGERSLYDEVRAYCKSIGREEDLFLLSASYPEESSIWNPCALGSPSELQTKLFNSAVYNEPHYAKACEYGLIQAFRRLCTGMGREFTIRDLIRELEKISEDEKDDTLKGLFFDLNNLVLGEWEPILACASHPKQTSKRPISILDIVKNNKILFVDLPTEGKKVQSSRVGRLLTQEIILISGLRKRNSSLKGDRPFSVYVDEFDAFATESFATFLNKGRSSEFMIHLAHQTLSDLNCISPEFAGQILGNCNVRFIFRQDDPDDAERWSRFFGTKRVVKQTYRSKDGSRTGESSNRESQEFTVPPDTIKSLKIGRCIFSVKTEGETRVIQIPFDPMRIEPKVEDPPVSPDGPLPPPGGVPPTLPIAQEPIEKWDSLNPVLNRSENEIPEFNHPLDNVVELRFPPKPPG